MFIHVGPCTSGCGGITKKFSGGWSSAKARARPEARASAKSKSRKLMFTAWTTTT